MMKSSSKGRLEYVIQKQLSSTIKSLKTCPSGNISDKSLSFNHGQYPIDRKEKVSEDDIERRRLFIDAIEDDEISSISNIYTSSSKRDRDIDVDAVHHDAIFAAPTQVTRNEPVRGHSHISKLKEVDDRENGLSQECRLNKVPVSNEKMTSLPLYKRLKKNDIVLAKYNGDGRLYEAELVAVMHGGYSSAMYDIRFLAYPKSGIQTISWRDVGSLGEFSSLKQGEQVGRDSSSTDAHKSTSGGSIANDGRRNISLERSDLETSAGSSTDCFGRDMPTKQATNADLRNGIDTRKRPSSIESHDVMSCDNRDSRARSMDARNSREAITDIPAELTKQVSRASSNPSNICSIVDMHAQSSADKQEEISISHPSLRNRVTGGWRSLAKK